MDVSTASVSVTLSQLEMFRRSFQCGHPDEFIEVRQDENGDQIHNLIKFEVLKECSRRLGDLPAYIQARCLNCAKEAKEQDDNNTPTRPKTLGTYQAIAKSNMTKQEEAPLLTDFDRALHRHYRRDDRNMGVQPHRRVSEHEHHTHRLEVLSKAVDCAGKWLAVPSRRLCNMPIQVNVSSRPTSRQHAQYHTNNVEHMSGSTEPGQNVGEGEMEYTMGTSLARTSRNNDESFQVAAVSTLSLSGSKLGRTSSEATAKPEKLSLTVTRLEGTVFDHTAHAHSPQRASGVISPGRESRLKEHLIESLESPLGSLSKLDLRDRAIRHAHPAPSTPSTLALPKKSVQEIIKRCEGKSTKRSDESGRMSMNFRNLSIDVHPSMSIEKTEPDSDSPDWACETSLAIESGIISVESVSRQYNELKRLDPEAIHGPGQRRNTCPSPFVDRSPASTRYGRHSEGAPHALHASAARKSADLAETEIASTEKKNPGRHNGLVAPSVNLNKRLPALPLPERTE